MKALLYLLLLTSACAGIDSSARLRQAIREVEAVSDPALPGPAGELGFFRITPGVWSQWTNAPFATCATNHELEEFVATQHLLWLANRLSAHGRQVTAYSVAMAWNGGVAGFLRGGNQRSRSYGRRVEALYLNRPHG